MRKWTVTLPLSRWPREPNAPSKITRNPDFTTKRAPLLLSTPPFRPAANRFIRTSALAGLNGTAYTTISSRLLHLLRATGILGRAA